MNEISSSGDGNTPPSTMVRCHRIGRDAVYKREQKQIQFCFRAGRCSPGRWQPLCVCVCVCVCKRGGEAERKRGLCGWTHTFSNLLETAVVPSSARTKTPDTTPSSYSSVETGTITAGTGSTCRFSIGLSPICRSVAAGSAVQAGGVLLAHPTKLPHYRDVRMEDRPVLKQQAMPVPAVIVPVRMEAVESTRLSLRPPSLLAVWVWGLPPLSLSNPHHDGQHFDAGKLQPCVRMGYADTSATGLKVPLRTTIFHPK
jgi:hypothetical protein